MSVKSYSRGHLIICEADKWIYADDKSDANIKRPCNRCGRMPTKEGYDACLGYIEGATSACCGHGVEKATIVWEN